MLNSILITSVLVHGSGGVFNGDEGPSLGLAAPSQGGLNEPCRTGVPEIYECDAGYECQIRDHGTFTTGTCRPRSNNQGGEGQRCRSSGRPCDSGLVPVTNWDNTVTNPAFSVPRCTCETRLGSGGDPFNDETRLGAGGDPFNDEESNGPRGLGLAEGPMLGQTLGHTGDLGEPCTDGNFCDHGLHCKISWHGTYSTGTCVHDRQHPGGKNQRCRTVQEGSPCDSGLRCETVRMYPQGKTQICREDDHHPAHPGQEGQRCRSVEEGSPCDSGLRCQRVRLLPSGHRDICQKVEAHNEGEANQRCNEGPLAPCNHNNLRPHYERIYPSGYSCTCKLNLAGPTPVDPRPIGSSSDTKLGMPAPHFGGYFEPCRNDESWENQCDGDLVCKHYTDGSATYARCEPRSPAPSPHPSNCGGQGQRCCGNSCNGNLVPVTNWEHQFGQALEAPVCRCESMLGNSGDDTKLGLEAPQMGGEGEPCGNGCDDGLYCRHWSEGASQHGECKKIPENHGGEGQKCFPAPMSPCKPGLKSTKDGEGQCKCETKLGDSPAGPKLGLPAPDLGTRGNGCRNGQAYPYTECDAGLYCQKWSEGTSTSGICVPYPNPSPTPSGNCGGQNQRCCNFGTPCYGNNDASWEHMRGQALEVCRCRPRLYSHGSAPAPGN